MQAIANAMSERTSRSRSSIRWERKVSWLSWASGIAALLARGAIARRGGRGRLFDPQLELRRLGPRRHGGEVRGRTFGPRCRRQRALDRGLGVAHLALHFARVRFHAALEGTRRALELALHLAQIG